ncbi:hypothetical protein E4U53_003144, partial [Claviceps sorghi]
MGFTDFLSDAGLTREFCPLRTQKLICMAWGQGNGNFQISVSPPPLRLVIANVLNNWVQTRSYIAG